jgi:porin
MFGLIAASLAVAQEQITVDSEKNDVTVPTPFQAVESTDAIPTENAAIGLLPPLTNSVDLSPCPPPPAYNSPFAGAWSERPFLLGDLGGWRDELASKGMTLNFSSTQFYQGVTSGGVRRDFQYAGRADLIFNMDGQKAGLWQGSFLTMHAETRYGQTVNGDTGAIMPANAGALFPVPSGSATALTAVKMTQALSENFIVFGGKINTLDELVQPYAAGRGVDAFMNAGLIFPVSAGRTVPYSTLGDGFAVLQEMHPVFSFMALDTHNTPTTSGFENFFTNGVSLLAKAEKPVSLFDLPGHQSLWGTYSTGKYNNLQPTAYYDPNSGPVIAFGRDTGSWAVFYSADQAFYVDPSNPARSWGLFTNVGLADNGPSPVRWSANVGLGGSSPNASRPLDTFGIGYSYVGYSDPVKELAPVLLPIGNDQAVELFYNYAVTPWLRLTPDLQVLIPARQRTLPPGAQTIDTALVIGLRAKINF